EALLDGAALFAAVRRVARALAAVGEPVAGAAAAVAESLGRAPRAGVELDALARDAVAGDWDSARALAARLDVDDDALVTLLDHAARPALRRAAAAARPALARHAPGARGLCPLCGAPPLLAELRGKERVRTLRCGRCAASWEFARAACPACGERDHRRLTALHGEGEADYRRADCCDSCRTYVKALATLDPIPTDALLATDLATSALDWAAVERGYHR
ncbi:MAG: formate dehydrogenase accessory protein FdhE, partial [Gemmatimonadaceae bacterium]